MQIVSDIVFVLIIIAIVVAWQALNAYNNSTDPSVAGRPLSNPHTHLHSVTLGGKNPECSILGLIMACSRVRMAAIRGRSHTGHSVNTWSLLLQ